MSRKDEDSERIDWQSVETHRIPGTIGNLDELYFPVNKGQVNDILGKILTQLEAMNLTEKSERANKAIFKQMVWHWFDEAIDNSVTSANGCIAPIKIKECFCEDSENSTMGCSQCSVKSPIKLVDPNK
jgi:hypothetical protein